MKSAIYRGTVRHRRRRPKAHDFTYGLFMMYLDLAELPQLFDRFWLWSARRPAPGWFRRDDYLGDAQIDLDRAVRDEAERLTGARPLGPVRMLTHLRYFGYVMNPVTFYYCFDARDESVDTILAEINNTPWDERHVYALRSEGGPASGTPHRFRKAFHISPFMSMEQDYSWRFSAPNQRLFVHMENHADGEPLFDATLQLRRHEIGHATLASALARYPWMTARVVTAIYWQAFRLWLKRTPYFEHPTQEVA
jgi:DUF1365 family protein